MIFFRLIFSALFIITVMVNTAYCRETEGVVYKGINIAGAEFNGGRKNSKHFKDYIWPTNKNLKSMKEFGFNTIRVPFSWTRMQPIRFGPLESSQIKELDRIVQQAHILGLNVIIDPHAYGTYNRKVLRNNRVDIRTFSDLWSRLARHYGVYPNVIYGLMNEPFKQSPHDWAVLAQAAVNAIRNEGVDQLILVPGSKWTGMHSWFSGRDKSNAEALINIDDPLNNFAYEMHQYFDKDSSGTHHAIDVKCANEERLIRRFEKVTHWLKQHQKRAFLAEFGVQENKSCVHDLEVALNYMDTNHNEWLGWTYWTYSKWMPKYPYNIFGSLESKDRRKIIKKHLTK